MPFKKGQSGNPKGREVRPFALALRLEACRKALVEDATGRRKLDADRRIARALIKKAESGDAQAAKEYADRRDGKAPQGLELTGKDGGPVRTIIEWKSGE